MYGKSMMIAKPKERYDVEWMGGIYFKNQV